MKSEPLCVMLLELSVSLSSLQLCFCRTQNIFSYYKKFVLVNWQLGSEDHLSYRILLGITGSEQKLKKKSSRFHFSEFEVDLKQWKSSARDDRKFALNYVSLSSLFCLSSFIIPGTQGFLCNGDLLTMKLKSAVIYVSLKLILLSLSLQCCVELLLLSFPCLLLGFLRSTMGMGWSGGRKGTFAVLLQ